MPSRRTHLVGEKRVLVLEPLKEAGVLQCELLEAAAVLSRHALRQLRQLGPLQQAGTGRGQTSCALGSDLNNTEHTTSDGMISLEQGRRACQQMKQASDDVTP